MQKRISEVWSWHSPLHGVKERDFKPDSYLGQLLGAATVAAPNTKRN